MPIAIGATGGSTVANEDLRRIIVSVDDAGNVSAQIEYVRTNIEGVLETHVMPWTLTAGEKATLAGLRPSMIAAIEAKYGIP